MADEEERSSSKSVTLSPVEHIADSVSRLDDENCLVQFGLDLTNQECQVSECEMVIDSEKSSGCIVVHSTSSDTLEEQVSDDVQNNTSVVHGLLTNCSSKISDDNTLCALTTVEGNPLSTDCESVLHGLLKTENGHVEYRSENIATCKILDDVVHQTENSHVTQNGSSTESYRDMYETKLGETNEMSFGTKGYFDIGVTYALCRCKSESYLHSAFETKSSLDTQIRRVFSHSSMVHNEKLNVNSIYNMGTDSEIDLDLNQISFKQKEEEGKLEKISTQKKGRRRSRSRRKQKRSSLENEEVTLQNEVVDLSNHDSDKQCSSNGIFLPLEPKEGNTFRNSDVVGNALLKDNFPEQENRIKDEHISCGEGNNDCLKLKLNENQNDRSKTLLDVCQENLHSSKFMQVDGKGDNEIVSDYVAEVSLKDSYDSSGEEEVEGTMMCNRKLFTAVSFCNKCPSCVYSCLYEYSGKLCTICGKQYIFTEVNGVPMLVSLHEEKCDIRMKNCCKILWRNQTPLVLSQVEDGVEVMFDAVMIPELNKFVALMTWHTYKPSIVTLPRDQYLMFLEENTGFLVQLVSLNAKKTDVETGVVKATINGQEKTLFFSANVVFLDGKKVSDHDGLLHFFQLSSLSYVTVNKFLLVGLTDKYIYVATCIWRGVKPHDVLLSPRINQAKLYNTHVSGTLPQELREYSTLHCDVPCKLCLDKATVEIFSSKVKCTLKFIVDNKIHVIECNLDRLYCGNNRITPITSFLPLSIGVKAHILKQHLEKSLETLEVMMVQVPEEVVTTLVESPPTVSAVEELRLAGREYQDKIETSGSTKNLRKDESFPIASYASTSLFNCTAGFSDLNDKAASQENHSSYNSACGVMPSNPHVCDSLSSNKISSNLLFKYASDMNEHSSFNSMTKFASVKNDNTSDMEVFLNKDAVSANFSSLKVESMADSTEYKGDSSLLSIAVNNLPDDNSHGISKSSCHSSVSSSTLCEASLPETQSTASSDTASSISSVCSSVHLPLKVDISHSSVVEHSSCSSSSLQYFSPNSCSPMSSISSYTSCSQVSGAKLPKNKVDHDDHHVTNPEGDPLSDIKTQPTKENMRGVLFSGLVNAPKYNPQIKWSIGMPVTTTSVKGNAGSSGIKLNPSGKTIPVANQVNQNTLKPELSLKSYSSDLMINQPQNVTSAKDKTVTDSVEKSIIYQTACKVRTISANSGIITAWGKICGVDCPKAHFLSTVLCINGASISGGESSKFRNFISPHMKQQWTCLLEECKPLKTNGVNVRFKALLMWLGTRPQKKIKELKGKYKIQNVVYSEKMVSDIEKSSSATGAMPSKAKPPVLAPKPPTLLLKGIIVAVSPNVGRLRSVRPSKEELQFTRNCCLLYNISLKNICLSEVIPCGLEVIYEEVNGKVKKVILEGSYRDADLLDPPTRYKLLKSWCEQYHVPFKSRDDLLVAGGWLPPELNPVDEQEYKKSVINLV